MNIENSELFNSIKEELDKRIKKSKTYLDKSEEKIKDSTKKLGMFDKMSINSDIKKYQEQIIKLTELNQSIATLRFGDNDKYILPEELKSQFDRLGTLLSPQETTQLRESVNNSLKNVNKDKKEDIKQKVINVEKILNQLKIGSNNFQIFNQYNQYTGNTISFNNAIKEIERNQLRNLAMQYSFISSKQIEIQLKNSDELLLSSLEEMIKNNQLEKNNNTQNIMDNFSSIKEAFVTKTRLEETLLVLNNTLSELTKITEIDFSKVESCLRQLGNKYQNELEKTNKFLSKFNFNDIKKQIETKKEQEDQKKLKNSYIIEYEQLAYELEKVMSENPGNYEKIQQIKEAMRDVTTEYEFSSTQLETAMVAGKTKYQQEQQEQRAKVETAKEKIAYEDQLKADVMKEIREYAIRELESSGAFDEEHELRNGDMHSKPIDKEAMIQRKIEELKRIADMTPEERGLEDQKRRGLINSDTRLEDLTPQQLNDLRVGYSDSSYEFMADYKNWKSREQVKPQANNVYREYIKYRTTLNDKNEFLSFSEYAKQMHNIENMSDIMVDEELKEEMRGVSR